MDKKTEKSIKNYNKIASNYDQTFDGRFTRSFKIELAKVMHIERGYRVLDVACGNGALLKLLSEKANIDAYGVDISENMIKEAKTKYPKMKFSVTNSAKLPFENGIFDIISVCAAFHHFTEPATFILEAKRVLRQGGSIFIADPYLPPVIRHCTNLILPWLNMGDVKIYSESELQGFFRKAGFVNISAKRIGKFGCMIMGVK